MTWDSLSPPWQAAFAQAWDAWCAGSLPVGCAIADRSDAVLFTGRNRIEEAEAPRGLLAGNQLAHAEMNALALLRSDRVDPRSCVLYSTLEPCPMCTGAIRMTGIGAVHYAARDALDGSMSLLEATPHMRRAGITVTGPMTPQMELVSLALFIAAFLNMHSGTGLPIRVMSDFQELAPDAVRKAQILTDTGTLHRLYAAGAPAPEVYDAIVGDAGPSASSF